MPSDITFNGKTLKLVGKYDPGGNIRRITYQYIDTDFPDNTLLISIPYKSTTSKEVFEFNISNFKKQHKLSTINIDRNTSRFLGKNDELNIFMAMNNSNGEEVVIAYIVFQVRDPEFEEAIDSIIYTELESYYYL